MQPTDAGWVDIAAGAPIMDNDRAREKLRWSPVRSSPQTIPDVLEGLGRGAGVAGSAPPRARQSLRRVRGTGTGTASKVLAMKEKFPQLLHRPDDPALEESGREPARRSAV